MLRLRPKQQHAVMHRHPVLAVQQDIIRQHIQMPTGGREGLRTA